MRDWRTLARSRAVAPVRARRPASPVVSAVDHMGLQGGEMTPAELLDIQRLAGNTACTSLVCPTPAAHGHDPVAQRSPDGEGQAGAQATPDVGELITAAESALATAEGKAFHFLPADLEGQSAFVLFDDPAVQRLFRHLLQAWFGGDEGLEDAPSMETPPAWVGEFRARALNVRPGSAGEGGGDHEARLAALASQLADAVALETPAQSIRRLFVEEIEARVGTVIMSETQINAQRKKTASGGLTPENFTTCIEFFSQVASKVMLKAGVSTPLLKGPNYYKEISGDPKAKGTLGPAWKPYRPGARPKPGDLLIFTFAADVLKDGKLKYGKGWFAHISILRAVEPLEPGATGPGVPPDPGDPGPLEKWISIDGGDVTAGEVIRRYYPDTGLAYGPGTIKRTVKGWIDIERAAEAGLAPKR